MENATERMTVNNEKLERDPVKTVPRNLRVTSYSLAVLGRQGSMSKPS